MVSKELTFSTMLVELDCLLDTRISLLAELDDSKFKDVIKMYHNRDIDEFPYYSFDKFKELYDNRDKSILKNAIVTPIMSLITEFVDKTLLQIINSPFHYQPKIIINIYPYKLSDDEITNIISLIINKTKLRATVEVIDKSIKELTVGYVKDNLSVMVMYKYYEWIEYHCSIKAFKSISCPEVCLFGPSIYFKPKQPNTNIKVDPISSTEELAKPLIGLKLFPINLFSFVIPTTEKQQNITT